MNEINNPILKSNEMRRVYKFAKEKKFITLDDVMTIYTSKQHSLQIIEYFIRNKILIKSYNEYIFIEDKSEEHIQELKKLDGMLYQYEEEQEKKSIFKTLKKEKRDEGEI